MRRGWFVLREARGGRRWQIRPPPRAGQDHQYSSVVIDLDTGPASITCELALPVFSIFVLGLCGLMSGEHRQSVWSQLPLPRLQGSQST